MANKIKDLEKVDRSQGDVTDTEPKLVNKDNGTTTFEDSSTEKVTTPEVVEGAANMDNTTTAQVKEDWIETPVVVREKRIIDERIGSVDYKDYLENLKTRNPKKYEAKKAELAKRSKENK